MRAAVCLLVPLLVAATGCDRIKEQAARLNKSSEKGSAVVPGSVRDISAAEFDSFISQKGKLVVVDFHAPWCGPSKQLEPVLDDAAAKYGGVAEIARINVDDAEQLAIREGVETIPDVRFYRDGKQVDRFLPPSKKSILVKKFATNAKGLTPAGDTPGEASAADSAPAIEPMKKDWLPPGIERR